jgi:hypothetical protein
MSTDESRVQTDPHADLVRALSAELARLDDLEEIFQRALELALGLGSSRLAFIGIVDAGIVSRASWRATDMAFEPPPGMIEGLVAVAAEQGTVFSRPPYLGAQLRAGDDVIGSLGAVGELAYSDVDRLLITSLAGAVGPAIEAVIVRKVKDQMLQGLSRLRADLSDVERSLRRLVAEGKSAVDGDSQ